MVGLLAFPHAPSTSAFDLRVLTLAWLLASLTAGLTISVGYAGLFNVSQASFYGLGAYTTALLTGGVGVPFELAILASVIVTAAVGWVLATTTLRVRGDYWILVSMAFTVALFEVLKNWSSLTGGLEGYFDIPKLLLVGIPLDDPITLYYCALGVLLVAYACSYLVARSFVGRAMLSTKYDPQASAMMGVSQSRYRLLAVTFSSAIAGLAGAFLTAVSAFIQPTTFDLLPSFDILIFVIVGGITSILGGIAAAVFFTVLIESFRSLADYQSLIYGFALMFAVFAANGVFRRPVRTLTNAFTSLRSR